MSEIYAVEINNRVPDSLFQRCMRFVGEKKQERILRFRRREDAERSLLGDVLIRTVICNTLKIDNCTLVFEYNEYGKPFFLDFSGVHFNISHSGKWVAAAFDGSPLGIDVECIRKIDFSIAERFFSKTEYLDIMEKEGKAKIEYFYDLWTLKESYIKAMGQGLSLPLSSFTIRKNNSGITIKSERDEDWYFIQYPVDPDYRLSVCAKNDNFPNQVRILNPFDLAAMIPDNAASCQG